MKCTGYFRAQLTSIDWTSLLRPEGRNDMELSGRRLLEANTQKEAPSFQLSVKNGMTRLMDCNVKCESSRDERNGYFVGFIRDITRKRKNETRIHQLAYFDELTLLRDNTTWAY